MENSLLAAQVMYQQRQQIPVRGIYECVTEDNEPPSLSLINLKHEINAQYEKLIAQIRAENIYTSANLFGILLIDIQMPLLLTRGTQVELNSPHPVHNLTFKDITVEDPIKLSANTFSSISNSIGHQVFDDLETTAKLFNQGVEIWRSAGNRAIDKFSSSLNSLFEGKSDDVDGGIPLTEINKESTVELSGGEDEENVEPLKSNTYTVIDDIGSFLNSLFDRKTIDVDDEIPLEEMTSNNAQASLDGRDSTSNSKSNKK